jgi:hypothetical protein
MPPSRWRGWASSRVPVRSAGDGERPTVPPKRPRFLSANTSSSCRTRGLHPQVIEVPVQQPPPGGDGRGLDSRKTRFLVAGFHTRFVPPPPFLTALAACSSPRPPACFSRSRSWSFHAGTAVPGEGRSRGANPRICAARDSHRTPAVTRSRAAEAILGPTRPWQARERGSRCSRRPPLRARSLDAVCCRIRLDRSC